MPKLIIKRLSTDERCSTSVREAAVAAMNALPSATCVAVLLGRVDAIRIEYNGDIQHFDDVESHLNRHGLTCVE